MELSCFRSWKSTTRPATSSQRMWWTCWESSLGQGRSLQRKSRGWFRSSTESSTQYRYLDFRDLGTVGMLAPQKFSEFSEKNPNCLWPPTPFYRKTMYVVLFREIIACLQKFLTKLQFIIAKINISINQSPAASIRIKKQSVKSISQWQNVGINDENLKKVVVSNI